MIPFLQEHIPQIITGIISAAGGILIGNRARKISEDNEIINMYKSALDDMYKRWNERFKLIEDEMTRMKRKHDSEIKELNQELVITKRDREELRKKYNSLKKAFDQYKKEYEAK